MLLFLRKKTKIAGEIYSDQVCYVLYRKGNMSEHHNLDPYPVPREEQPLFIKIL